MCALRVMYTALQVIYILHREDTIFNVPEIHNIPIANKNAESIHKGHTLNYKSQCII